MVRDEFIGVDFGDERLNKRGLKVIETVENNPGKSFPKQANTWSDLKGLYRFFSNKKVTHKEIILPHIKNTVKRCFEEETVLIVQDTTYLDYSKHPMVKGLGRLGIYNRFRGMLAHSAYAVSGKNKKPLGLIHQQIIVRKEKKIENETSAQRLLKKRESAKWEKGLRASYKLLSEHKRVIQVCDREADIYNFIKKIQNTGQGFVIRCAQNRTTQKSKILTEIEQASIRGFTKIAIQRNGKRKKRTATAVIKSCKVNIKAPQIIKRQGPILAVNVVVVEEQNTPPSAKKLFWILLTSEDIETLTDCLNIIRYYKFRWLIEDFHKGLKSGCKIEERQLQTEKQLEKILGIFSVITYQLLLLRFHANNLNSANDNVARQILNETQVLILKHKFSKHPKDNLTPDKLLLLVAKLGGFIGRKSDQSPGWLTLMRGMYDLILMEYGFILAKTLVGKG